MSAARALAHSARSAPRLASALARGAWRACGAFSRGVASLPPDQRRTYLAACLCLPAILLAWRLGTLVPSGFVDLSMIALLALVVATTTPVVMRNGRASGIGPAAGNGDGTPDRPGTRPTGRSVAK